MLENDLQKQKELTQLAKRIRDARKKVQMSQAALAHSIGVSDKSVSAYEKARSIPPFDKLKKIAEQTNFPLTYFIDEPNVDDVITTHLNRIEEDLTEIKSLLRQK